MKRAVALSLALAAACGAPEEPSNEPITETLLELDLLAPLPEQGSAFLGEKRPGLAEAATELRQLADDPLARGLFVRLGPHAGHLADVDEWADVFETFRAAKKPVHCHFDGADNAAYALGAHCDRLSMTPAGSLELVGLAAQVVFGKDLLELVGVQADLMQMGKYKGAAEPFTRSSMSPELRESLDGMLTDLNTRFREHLARRFDRPDVKVEALIDGGPYSSTAARAAGLVDAVIYDDEARAKAKEAAGARVVKRMFEPRENAQLSLKEIVDTFAGAPKPRIDRPHLGLAFLKGEIVDGEREAVDKVAGGSFVHALRKFGDDQDVKAVVLRIESPGGSALASDRMWHAVRRVAKRKPVIVSVGDMAASGGYYVACAGTRIVAAPSSIVGSIGVVGGKMVVRGLTDKVGVHVESIERARHATWLSPFAPFGDEERKLFEAMLTDTYDRFLNRVAEGRKKTVAEILPGAEGRIMGGARAKALGLVDELGSLGSAMALARKDGNLPKDAPIDVWPEQDNPLRALSQFTSGSAEGRALEPSALVPPGSRAYWVTQGALLSVLLGQREPVAATLPFALDVR